MDEGGEQQPRSLVRPRYIKDLNAIRAAITEPWSNSQTERHVSRLKIVKCQMYGRAKIDLLEARLIGAA